MTISQEQYKKFQQYARLIAKNHFNADDLLNSTLLKIIEIGNFEQVLNLDNYVYMAMRFEFYRSRSTFSKIYKEFQANWTDLEPYQFEVELNNSKETWMGSRITNEQLDILITRLPFFEREVFNLYVMNDFSYRELSNETGIPVSYLYDTVKRAKEEIKKYIKYDE
jgi:RNA polymerase sigma factor (sigma-70 family)